MSDKTASSWSFSDGHNFKNYAARNETNAFFKRVLQMIKNGELRVRAISDGCFDKLHVSFPDGDTRIWPNGKKELVFRNFSTMNVEPYAGFEVTEKDVPLIKEIWEAGTNIAKCTCAQELLALLAPKNEIVVIHIE